MYSASFLAIATYWAYAASEVDFLIHWKSGGQVRVQVIMAISFLKAMAVSSVLICQGWLLQHALFEFLRCRTVRKDFGRYRRSCWMSYSQDFLDWCFLILWSNQMTLCLKKTTWHNLAIVARCWGFHLVCVITPTVPFEPRLESLASIWIRHLGDIEGKGSLGWMVYNIVKF